MGIEYRPVAQTFRFTNPYWEEQLKFDLGCLCLMVTYLELELKTFAEVFVEVPAPDCPNFSLFISFRE